MSGKRVIIVGAGYGGMALANLLAKRGYQVDVYEKNESLGGRIAAVKQDGYTFDIGPSWYLMPEVFEQYYQLFGESAEQRLDLMRFRPGYKVYFDNEDPLVIQGDVTADKNVFESIEEGAGRKLERYVARSTSAYELALKYFLYTDRFGLRSVLHWPIIRHAPSMIGLTLRTLDAYVSRTFRDQRLRQLLEYHMVFLGSSPFQAPAIYTLMSHLDFRSGVFYPRRGMLSLPDDLRELGERYDVTYHTSQPVARIIVEDGRARGIELESGEVATAGVVVSNADLHFTETKLLDPEHSSYPEKYWQKRQPGPGGLLISLGVKGELPELLHHNLYFVDDWRANFRAIYETKTIPEHASVYVCNPTKTDPSLAPEGHENLFVLVPIPAGVSLDGDEQEELVQRILAGVADKMRVPDLLERVTSKYVFGPEQFASAYNAWQHNAFGGESHLLSQSILFRTPNQSKKVDGLYYVGAGTLPGIGLPMCLISAQLTYRRIVGLAGDGPLAPEDV